MQEELEKQEELAIKDSRDEAEPQPQHQEIVDEKGDDTPLPNVGKTFSQDEINELVGRTRIEARDKALKGLYEKYGVDNDKALDELFGRGQAYEVLNDNYTNTSTQLKDALTENALLKSHITPERWNDVKLILTGKGLEVTPENITVELATHPEWMGQPQVEQPQKNIELEKFGIDTPQPDEKSNEEDEEAKMMSKFFRL